MFRYIKWNLTDVLMLMQKDQMFRKSEGADGIPLGYYGWQKNNKRLREKPGKVFIDKPYDMVFTGRLRDKMRVKVTLSYIEFSSDKSHVFRIQNRPFWGTTNWFGLTDANKRKLIDEYLEGEAIDITKRKFRIGKWI